MSAARINYVELPACDFAATRAFYAAAFDWALTDYGPDYACTTTGDVDLGLTGDMAEASAAPLPVIAVDDLEAAEAQVRAAGGTISRAIFAFPGGRRFHFRDPAGNELAVWKAE
ncbi:VOC family protein [Glacieibacterium frigidum]|uniref:VOC family protein n=1 Tax=Glacieibacterium frigidum TaxID=2593303 RepID=A0A552U9V6_9SPHN|nr:VOC family protein [Glacieibacterium frigidum]TRW15004.1 VOC family protein [Glacieibacterium frigidum]